jgi:hypothetical protein
VSDLPRLNVVDDSASGAWVSDDGLYRYRLWRRWDDGARPMVFLMLNPSTADAKTDDPTIRRCIGFAKREGCGAIQVVNLYALRATNPAHLLDHPDPEGPDNCMAWAEVLHEGDPLVVAAWGGGVTMDGLPESKALRSAGRSWVCFGITKTGAPRHPLYLGNSVPLEPFA